MEELFHSTVTWYAVSFIIFWAFAFKPAVRAANSWLDGKIARVRHDIDAAAALRAEAEHLLAEARARHDSAAHEAADIVRLANDEANHIRLQADADLMAALKRREEQAVERIAQSERQAQAELQQLTARLAIEAVRDMLQNGLSDADRSKLTATLAAKATGDIAA